MSESLLKRIYYDPVTGFQGVQNLYKRAKESDPTITTRKVEAWLKRQATNQIHAAPERIKHYWPIKSNYKDHIWQTDLLDVSAMAHNNSGVNFLLCVVDIYTRFAWVRALKNKEAKTVTTAFLDILEESKRSPKILMSDNGSEYVNKSFKALETKFDIEPSYAEPGDHHRQGIVERFNKTIRAKMVCYMTAYKTKKYLSVLDSLVKNYNTSPHSSLGGYTPSKPDDAKIAKIIAKKEFKASQEQTEFDVGDEVRSLKNRVMFKKHAIPKYSSTVHTITNNVGNKRYELDNGKVYLYYQLKAAKDAESFEPPPSQSKETTSEPKKQRLALKKEGVEKINVREGLRERKPQNQVVSKHGEKIIW